jgi:hypothetical protein
MNFNLPVDFDDEDVQVDNEENEFESNDLPDEIGEQENLEDDDNDIEYVEENENNPYEELYKAFVENEIIDMPESELDEIKTPAEFLNLIQGQIVNKKVWLQEFNDKLPEPVRLIVEQSLKGDTDINEFIKGLVYNIDITNLSTDDLVECKEIIYQHGLLKKMDKEDVEELIEMLSANPEKLKEKAKKVFVELKELSTNAIKKKMETQNLIEEEETAKSDFFSNRLTTQLKQKHIQIGNDYLPIDRDDAELMIKASSQVAKIKVKGKVVEMPLEEALVHYHKYNKDGQIQNYMLAMMALENPSKLINYFKDQAKKDIIKESRSDIRKTSSITFKKPMQKNVSENLSHELNLLIKKR